MAFFNLPSSRALTKNDKKLLSKMQAPAQSSSAVVLKGSTKLIDRIQAIETLVKSKFAGKESDLLLITTEEQLSEYIDECIKNDNISIDTETTGLNPIIDNIVGMSIYTPTLKPAYIPINHVSYITMLRCADQLDISILKKYLQKLEDAKTKSYWFNAPFDIRFIGNHIGVWLTPYYDASVAASCLNSDEPDKTLKGLHNKYCWQGKGESLTYGKLFEQVPFNLIPIPVAYLYAASDGLYTWELCDYQLQYLSPEGPYYEQLDMSGVANVFFNIEMASMPSFIQMEQTGVAMDYEYAKSISEKYHEYLKKLEADLDDVYKNYKDTIDSYRRCHPKTKIEDPPNFNSATQLAEILYDVFQLKSPDKKKPRGTDADILEAMNHPICKAVSDVKLFKKQISTYVDKIPEEAATYPDKRIHCSFNQHGAETGRVSSRNPNLQNIPSRPFKLSDGTTIDAGHDVRQFFMATPGYVLLSCDYSGQEVRVTAHLSNDKNLIQAYKDDKDPYSEVASIIFNMPYEDCCEHYANGDDYPEGKARRGAAKPVVLGILYGRGTESVGEALGKTKQEAKAIHDKVLSKFEGLAKFLKDSEEQARKFGYVTTVWGRRRQLPDMQLPYYEFSYANGVTPDFDPLSDDIDSYSTEVPLDIVRDLTNKLLRCDYKNREILKERIRQQGINIVDNGSLIARARRQCVNSRVQGSSADLTKLAQVELFNNKELKDLGYRMLIPVHDEIIGECPLENAKECARLISQCMIMAGRDLCVPLKCDVDLFDHWYGEKLHLD